MNIQQLEKLVEKKCKTNSSDFVRLSNIWKKPQRNILCLGIYASHGLTSSVYQGHIEMDFNGIVLDVINSRNNTKFKPLSSIVGKKIDLNSFEKNYDKIIKSRPVGVESCNYLGFIDSTGVHIFNHKNIDSFPLTENYEGSNDRKETHGNFELVAEWKKIVKKYRKNIKSSTIYNDGITYFRTHLEINGYAVQLELTSFFNYSASIRIFSKKENKKEFHQNEVIELNDSEISTFDSVMSEIMTRKISNVTKARILSNFSGVKHVSLKEINNTVIADIRLDGDRGRPKGKYEFQFDFKTKQVMCVNGASKKFVPKKLEELNKRIKFLEKNNYFFV